MDTDGEAIHWESNDKLRSTHKAISCIAFAIPCKPASLARCSMSSPVTTGHHRLTQMSRTSYCYSTRPTPKCREYQECSLASCCRSPGS